MPTGNSRSDAGLLAATPADPDAFAAFYRRYVRMVAGVVARRVAPADVADVVAEVFAAALIHRRSYDPERGSGGQWLTGIAVNKAAEAARRGAVEARLCHRLGLDLRAVANAAQRDRESAELLAGLPAAQRRAVEARVLDGKPYRQIAREAAVSEQVARKRVSRALRTLRSRIQEERK
jgi:RNA polymerase sigma-70 factor (ECF subfamily)